jgi:hypothetical protein
VRLPLESSFAHGKDARYRDLHLVQLTLHTRLCREPPRALPISSVANALNNLDVGCLHIQGDPSAAPYAVSNAKAILGKLPVFGICMGHQIIGQALGATTFKLPFGHHGGNHPIRDMDTGKVQISAQNHNFAVDLSTLPDAVNVSHINLNDGTTHCSALSSQLRACCDRWLVFGVHLEPGGGDDGVESRNASPQMATLVMLSSSPADQLLSCSPAKLRWSLTR